jgi:hypothetical protein
MSACTCTARCGTEVLREAMADAPQQTSNRRYIVVAEKGLERDHFGTVLLGCTGIMHCSNLPTFDAIYLACWIRSAVRATGDPKRLRGLVRTALGYLKQCEPRASYELRYARMYGPFEMGAHAFIAALHDNYRQWCASTVRDVPCLACLRMWMTACKQ